LGLKSYAEYLGESSDFLPFPLPCSNWNTACAQTTQQARKRREYLDTVFAAIPLEPFTRAMAQLAAKIDAEARHLGRTIPFADLLIGATALHFGYAVGRSSHFLNP
jgi:predicted nucleic acid-binding protein